jgi:hypothetical protein
VHSSKHSSGLRAALASLVAAGCLVVYASDHGDVPASGAVTRQDANITDLHAFLSPSGDGLVLVASTNAAIPRTATSYVFPSDTTFEIHVDADAAVAAEDPACDGGTILEPGKIHEDITFRVRFSEDGEGRVHRIDRRGRHDVSEAIGFFAGLRDDPFIRIPRDGRNVGAIVLEVPLDSVVRSQSTLLVWATSKVEEFGGPFQDLAGRSLRSMFPEQAAMDAMFPRHHMSRGGASRPDVLIFDTAWPADFPNGRALTDDVVLTSCLEGQECRVFNSENRPPIPRENDLPFLTEFPYLAPPHLAP